METTTNNTYQLLPAAQRAMQKEYGNDVAYILISEGCNCIADVTAEQLEQAMERADRETRDFGAQTLVVDATDATMEGEPISICTE